MSVRSLGIVVTVVLGIGCGSAPSAPGPSTPTPSREAPSFSEVRGRLDPIVAPWVRDGWASGLSIVLVRGDEVELASYGRATDGGSAPDADTVYEIGSVTKVFTAIALAVAVARGEVTLDTPVAALLPEGAIVPGFEGEAITLAHLATHTSALPEWPPDFAPAVPSDPSADYDAAHLRASLAVTTLTARPGSVSPAYSSFGLGLLGHALAARAGTDYEAMVVERICAPLGMRDTRIVPDDALRARLARGHDEEGRPVEPWTWARGGVEGAGALRSTPRDMARFVLANLRPDGELATALRLAQTPRVPLRNGGAVGLGWGIADTGVLEHEGQTHGFHSWVGVDPARGVGVVVLSNTAGGPIAELGRNVIALLADRPFEPVVLPTTIALDPARLAELAGEYELAPGAVCRVTLEGDALRIVLPGQVPHRLYPSAPDELHLRIGDVRVRFERDEDGTVRALAILQGDHTTRASRLR